MATSGLVKGGNAKERKREWYVSGFSGTKKIITKPFKSGEGQDVMTLEVPVSHQGRSLQYPA